MRICAALSWFDEEPVLLDRCVRSLDGVADCLVALDGVWNGFPAASARSPAEQSATITAAAEHVGLEVRCMSRRGWRSQVEKRSSLFRAGWDAFRPDWVLVIDADEYVASCDPGALRAILSPHHDVASLPVVNVTGELAGMTRDMRRVFRASPGLTVERWHYGYRNENGWLDGDRAFVRRLPAVHLATCIRIVHDDTLRGLERRQAKHDYVRYRARERVEA